MLRTRRSWATPSAFADFVFQVVNPHIRKKVDTSLQAVANVHDEELKRLKDSIVRKELYDETPQGWEVAYCDLENGPDLISKSLSIGRVPLFCRPDLVLIQKRSGRIAIFDVKITNGRHGVPENLETLWKNHLCQMWCYGLIDNYAKAKHVRLIVRYWKRVNATDATPVLPPVFWERDRNFKIERECKDYFDLYRRTCLSRYASEMCISKPKGVE